MPAALVVAAVVSLAVLSQGAGAATPRAASGAPRQSAPPTPETGLRVRIESISPTAIRPGRPLTVSGVVVNTTALRWHVAQAYLQIAPNPATTLGTLGRLGRFPDDPGIGTTIVTYGLFDTIGDIPRHQRRPFSIRVPYDALQISGIPGAYRIGVKVVAGGPAGRDPSEAARATTWVPLYPSDSSKLVPASTVTLLPIVAPVRRLARGPFTDDSLTSLLRFGGRLWNVVQWGLLAPPDTVQVLVDPALLNAVASMAQGYVVRPAGSEGPGAPGTGQADAQSWLSQFRALAAQQHVLLLPWGVPAANSLADHKVRSPIAASIRASEDYQQLRHIGTAVAGLLPDGRTGLHAMTVLHRAGADIQIVAQQCLPGLNEHVDPDQPLPSYVTVDTGQGQVPALVTTTRLAGRVTDPHTTPLQFKQRLVADALVRSLSGKTDDIRVTMLPFLWNPGPSSAPEGLADAFDGSTALAQSVIGAIDRQPREYAGPVRLPKVPVPGLSGPVLDQIRRLHVTGGNLAAILTPSVPDQRRYERMLAMSGSIEWRRRPREAVTLVSEAADFASHQLSKVTLTGPPFVAMSSNSGRFPLTVTNGLAKPVTLRLSVVPDNTALRVGTLNDFVLPPGGQRDIQVVTTASGTGVTTVRARLATVEDIAFGRTWKFDVRATQIGLVIWVVMGVGGAILLVAALYRIVKRLRSPDRGRRRATAR